VFYLEALNNIKYNLILIVTQYDVFLLSIGNDLR